MSADDRAIDEALAKVKLLSVDVDGVQTDGGLYYLPDGSEIRKFNVKDGLGMKIIQEAGVFVALITASEAPCVRHRGERLGLNYVCTGVKEKLEVLKRISEECAITLDEVAHIGDDINDLPVLTQIGCPVTVADGVAAVKHVALWTTESKGGDGAVREVCDRLLAAKGLTVDPVAQAETLFDDGPKKG